MLETIKQLINQRLNRVLLIAQSSLSQSQYEAFRKLVLDEFGRSGLATELDRVWRGQGKDR